MSAIERVLNRLEEKILTCSDKVTGQEFCRDGLWGVLLSSPAHCRGSSEATSIAGMDKIIGIFRLEETSKITKSSHSPTAAKPFTKPCP